MREAVDEFGDRLSGGRMDVRQEMARVLFLIYFP